MAMFYFVERPLVWSDRAQRWR